MREEKHVAIGAEKAADVQAGIDAAATEEQPAASPRSSPSFGRRLAEQSKLVIGICGGSGSGKSTITDEIVAAVRANGGGEITVVQHDLYYKALDEAQHASAMGGEYNFDHPSALETQLLVQHLQALKRGEDVELPRYDFETHSRVPGTDTALGSASVIIVEGILIFEHEALRDELDILAYIDTSADLRILRRATRDMAERGRTMAQVVKQYEDYVRPMHILHVEPYKQFANIVLPEDKLNHVATRVLVHAVLWELNHPASD